MNTQGLFCIIHEFLEVSMVGEYLKRNIDDELLVWKNDKKHKVLLLRGASVLPETYYKIHKKFVET
jgi:hypothetical protein